jgi:LysR family transcriptional regulator for metE and metH
MEMRHLRLVQTLAVEGTLTAAGKRLYLTQSALSHQLREIEDEFGIKLFDRCKKRMVLTPAGERMLGTADVVLGEVENIRDEITRMVSGESGILRISACRYTGFHWLPTVLGHFKKRFPRVEVRIDHSSTNDPTEHLTSGSIDLAIVNVKHDRNGIAYLKLFDDEMVAIVRGDHRWASRSYVGAKHFADEHLIGYDIPFEEVVFNKQVLQPAGITPQSLLKLPTTDAIIEMVKAGMGVAVMNLWSVRPYLESLDLRALRLTRNGYQRTWYAAVPNGGKQPPFISHFIGFLTLSQN